MQAASIKETLATYGGQFSAFIATGVSTKTVKSGKGRLCRISITAAGTTSFTVFDSLSGSGSAIYVSPTSTSLGTVIDVQIPVEIGITIVNTATGPAFAVSFD